MVKNLPAMWEDPVLVSGSVRSFREGNDYPLRYSCWRIPWTEKPGWLQSLGSQRVGHDWVTNTFQSICSVVGLLGHMIDLFLVFKGTSIPFSIRAVSVYIPSDSVRRFPLFSTSSPAFIVCRFFDIGCSDQCEVISHCSFYLHFSNNERCWTSFHVFICHLYVFFRENVCLGLLPIFD